MMLSIVYFYNVDVGNLRNICLKCHIKIAIDIINLR